MMPPTRTIAGKRPQEAAAIISTAWRAPRGRRYAHTGIEQNRSALDLTGVEYISRNRSYEIAA